MILKVHLQGAASHDVGDEIWQEALGDAIRAEAESIVYTAGPDLLAIRPQPSCETGSSPRCPRRCPRSATATERRTASCTR